MSRISSILVAAALAFAVGHAARADLMYSVADLGTLGWSGSSIPGFPDTAATGINSFGQVAGSSRDASGTLLPFIWSSSAGIQNLGALPVGASYGEAFALNDNQTVVGTLIYSNNASKAFTWSEANGFTLFSTGTIAATVNLQGSVAGSFVYGGTSRAYKWLIDGSYGYALYIADHGKDSKAVGINDTGYIVVAPSGANDGRTSVTNGLLLSPTGTITNIPGFGYGSNPTAINNQNQIVGSSQYIDGPTHAFFSQNGTTIDLGSLGGNDKATSFL